ncbi:MAG TPA: L-idonate 5-dehydrogenase [Amaricoccus sp.]|uniref:L-idonate 5-dehydrogenase n=1 Tax=Amaricoccus sp. TaxID=1872485 RepID=UPI002B9C090A|nr:L-idonate 5-dehydrogenase [Amaricoccus sp.]HMQ92870.1 L-idonate 5-dehydrogenase [Amaricoccus sp.]HMR52867.1 L-idonate 5-dehydrogenase [Amaricoccus sp.]HMR60032.1 L-idonate 5-dehydrogenase [Amaricoccus sp.]HMT99802.1 L-idonate 5-dehydrogenase [Amaricoccus sp.]
MYSIVAHGPRDLRLDEGATPEAPGPGEVAVALRIGGICGSDLHYFNHGGFGTVRLREPMVLGHEVAGTIAALGEGVSGLALGQTVAVNPSRPCGACANCRRGRANLCTDMRFNGSAMRFPHVQGLFRESVVVPAAQAVPVEASPDLAALCEPFAVCLHAAARAGSLLGARVLVSGSGPIGCLTVLAARLAGAAEIVVTDIAEPPLAVARALGATATVDVAASPDGLDGRVFDAAFECSGNGQALLAALKVLRAGGRLVLVGLGGEVTLPIAGLVPSETEIVGSFRFDGEFAMAADLISRGRVDPSPLITHTLPMRRAEEAFVLASDRAAAMKVQIALGA